MNQSSKNDNNTKHNPPPDIRKEMKDKENLEREAERYLQDFRRNQKAAYFIRQHIEQKEWHRTADDKDDYYKAEYLNYLVHYYRSHKGTNILLDGDNSNFQSLIDMVFSIFDHAYYMKRKCPYLSDLHCFTEAERTYCSIKKVEYVAYLNCLNRMHNGLHADPLSDYFEAEKQIKTEMVAYLNYKDRLKKGLPDDSLADYYDAEKQIELVRTAYLRCKNEEDTVWLEDDLADSYKKLQQGGFGHSDYWNEIDIGLPIAHVYGYHAAMKTISK